MTRLNTIKLLSFTYIYFVQKNRISYLRLVILPFRHINIYTTPLLEKIDILVNYPHNQSTYTRLDTSHALFYFQNHPTYTYR